MTSSRERQAADAAVTAGMRAGRSGQHERLLWCARWLLERHAGLLDRARRGDDDAGWRLSILARTHLE